jgi:hypothetical protein
VNVEQKDIGADRDAHLDRLGSLGRNSDDVHAFVHQQRSRRGHKPGVVVDEQNATSRHTSILGTPEAQRIRTTT